MKQYKPINLVAVLLVSFVAWVYCVAPAVLGLIYQAYPGQDSVSVLIATLPTVVTMIVAFLSTVIFRFVPRKWMAITSMVIALICGAVILIFPLPLMGVIVCSALLGIPRSLVYSIAPISGVFIILAQIINIYEDITGEKVDSKEGADK